MRKESLIIAPVNPAPHDPAIIMASRDKLERLQAHLHDEYARHPSRLLRQSLMIVQHILKSTA